MNPSAISLEDLDGSSNKLIHTVWMRSSRISEGALGLSPPFFHSLSLDSPATMEELYRRADKYSTLEDNIWAASQTVMITAQSSKSVTKGQFEPKGSQNKSKKHPWDQLEKEREPPQFTPLNISYDRLLPLIWDHRDFKWTTPIQLDPA